MMIVMAPKGHFLGQIPQPIHSDSERKAIRESGVTSICEEEDALDNGGAGSRGRGHGDVTYTKLSTPDHRATLLALLPALLGLALVRADNGDTERTN